MGLFDLFRRRAERESAVSPSAAAPPPSASIDDQPVVGQQVSGLGAPQLDLGGFLTAGSQSIDMTGAQGLREEIFEIMRRHGIDPESGATESVDASAMPQMQQEILEALTRHGLNLGGAGSAGASR